MNIIATKPDPTVVSVIPTVGINRSPSVAALQPACRSAKLKIIYTTCLFQLLLCCLITISAAEDVGLSTLSTSDGFRILGAAGGDESGRSVSAAGDVNGDGIDDVIVGAYFASPPSGVKAGISYVIFGRNVADGAPAFGDIQLTTGTTPMSASIGFRILGASGGDNSGLYVSAAGDVNGDGIGDVIVGARVADPPSGNDAGISYVIFGRNIAGGAPAFGDIQLTAGVTPMSASIGFRILGAAGGDNSGVSVSSAGDMNGDGIGDVIVGANNADPPSGGNAGISYVIFGRNISEGAPAFGDIQLTTSATAILASIGFRILGAAGGDQSGSSVSAAGDVNGDGIGDVIIAATGADPPSRNDAGISYVIFGRNVAGGAPAFEDVQLTTGAITFADSIGFRIFGAAAGDNSGTSVSAAGDVNGDGIGDVIVGARVADPPIGANAGVSYVIFGRNVAGGAPAFGDIQLTAGVTPMSASIGFRILGPAGGDFSGFSVSAAGDMNGDGIGDVIVGAFLADPLTGGDAGISYVIFGRNIAGGTAAFGDIQLTTGGISMSASIGFRILGALGGDQSGVVVSTAGDMNGDGIGDVIVGAFLADPPTGTSAGISYVVFGTNLQPTSLPSSQPSNQPSVQPSSRPTSPSSQPTVHPTSRPSQQPSSQPTTQPSGKPRGQPSTQPSSQPSCRPSAQPSAQPSNRPSMQPSAPPSNQPSAQPSGQPSTCPSTQSSAQPSNKPSGQPSALPSSRPSAPPTSQPSSLPSTIPSAQPFAQPSTQPSIQPSAEPSGQPSSSPSSQPTSSPTVLDISREWVTEFNYTAERSRLAHIDDAVWLCGVHSSPKVGSFCVVINATRSRQHAVYHFKWTDVVSVTQGSTAGSVVLSGHALTANTISAEIATCVLSNTMLKCSARSFAAILFTAGSYALSVKKSVQVGTYNTQASVTFLDPVLNTASTYQYTSTIMKQITFTHVLSSPNYVGSFVAGTCVNLGSINYIYAGIVRADSGSMVAMYLNPTRSNILNSADLVNVMAQEYVQPDSFIGGGLQLSDGGGVQAYLLRVNPLYQKVLYCTRYTMRPSTQTSRRRVQSANRISSVVKGIIRVESTLYLVVNIKKEESSADRDSVSVLKVDMLTGSIIKQVQVCSSNASILCAGILTTGLMLMTDCTVRYEDNNEYTLLLSVDTNLTFAKLPRGFERYENSTFAAESIAFQHKFLPLTSDRRDPNTAENIFDTEDGSPSRRPSVIPTSQPSSQRSLTPSGQPSSCPTAAPSVSPQPTSHPSSSGPTNTYRPTVKPTQQPSAEPSIGPTLAPTTALTTTPTLWPSAHPSLTPSSSPNFVPSATPSRVPIEDKPTRVPSPFHTTQAPSTTEPVVQSGIVNVNTNQGISKEVLIFVYVICAVVGAWCAYRFRIWLSQALEAREKDKGIRKDLDALRIPLEDQPPHGFNLPGRLAVYQNQRGSAFNARISPIGRNATFRVPAVSAKSEGANILSPSLKGAFAESSAISSTYSGDAPTSGAFIVGKPVVPLLDDARSVSSADSFALSSLHSSEMNDASDAYWNQNKRLESAAEEGCAVQIDRTQLKINLIELDRCGEEANEGMEECSDNSESSESNSSSTSSSYLPQWKT